MPYVMAWNAPAIQDELAQIAAAMGLPDAQAVIPAIAALFERIGIPPTLRELGLAQERIDWVAEQSCGISRLIQNNLDRCRRPTCKPSLRLPMTAIAPP